jgi:vacuolar protein sorting-associated protein 45
MYPFIDPGDGSVTQASKEKPQDIIIFMIGGTTYEESKMIASVNDTLPGVRIVIGGTQIHNAQSFLHVNTIFPHSR